MIAYPKTFIFLQIILLSVLHVNHVEAQPESEGKISGQLTLTDEWDNMIYLSFIPSFDDMYAMSNEMIISKTVIDSLGKFEFNLDFLPEQDHLFRLHITKKGDTSASLIIGGVDENHLFFIANRHSKIKFHTTSTKPPFRNLFFKYSSDNTQFKTITDLVFRTDSIASESTASKRTFIENKTEEELLLIADTISNPLISLYAIYNTDYELGYENNIQFFKSYLKKWKHQDDNYFKTFKSNLPLRSTKGSAYIYVILAILFSSIGFLVGKLGFKKNKGIKKLTVQERKIFSMLKEGASNQDISEQYNIGISTVKSHVSSILKKMNVRSRKELMNM